MAKPAPVPSNSDVDLMPLASQRLQSARSAGHTRSGVEVVCTSGEITASWHAAARRLRFNDEGIFTWFSRFLFVIKTEPSTLEFNSIVDTVNAIAGLRAKHKKTEFTV